MKKIYLLALLVFPFVHYSQTTADLFSEGKKQVSWLGIDYSHVKLIGTFSQVEDAGKKTVNEIKNDYFPGWNNVIVREPKKFDIYGMMRVDKVKYDVSMITALNQKTELSTLEAMNTPDYSKDDIQNFVKTYDTKTSSAMKKSMFIPKGLKQIFNTADALHSHGIFHFKKKK